MTTNPAATVLNAAEAWEYARGAEVGRLAVVVDRHPDIFPVNFVVDRGSVVFRTAEGTKLMASVGQPVAFEVDGYDSETGEAWSVVVKGEAHEVRDLYQTLDAIDLPLEPWHASPKPRMVRIEPTEVTGRRFTRVRGVHHAHAHRASPE